MLSTASRRFLGGAAASRRSVSTLVLAETQNDTILPQTLSCITAAKKVGGQVTVLVAGSEVGNAANAAAKINGVDTVIHNPTATFDHSVAENMTELLLEVQGEKNFTHILASSTNEGKNILPRLAAKLDVAPISDVVEVQGEDTFVRTMYAGNALATVQTSEPVKLLTIQGTKFEKAGTEGGNATVEESSAASSFDKCSWVNDEVVKSDRPDLSSASVVVSGGRGMKNGENFGMLYDLADKLNAGVGASRAACDAGYVPNDLQVGQTGKVVAPDLYIAVGISGAIQHLAGMKDSKTIVCVNKDPEAPIFQVSDYGLEADLFKAVPEMVEKL